MRKKHVFLIHYGQAVGNRGNSQLPINILRRDPTKYSTISYDQLKNIYNFFEEHIMVDFLDSAYARFDPDDQYKIQR